MNILLKKIVVSTSAILFSCAVGADTLQEAVMRTVQTNPDVLANIKGWLAAQEGVNRAEGGYLPSVDVMADFGEDHAKNNNNNFQYRSLTTSGVGITLRQLVFDGFATSSEVDRTRSHSTSEKYHVEGVANDTGLLATKAYMDVLTNQQIVGYAKENYQVHQNIYNMVQHRSGRNVSRSADLAQASGRLALARTNLLTAENNYMDSRATYYKIVGVMPRDLSFPNEPSDSSLPGNEIMAIQSAVDNQPLLKMSQADVDAAKALHEASKAANYPHLDAVLSASTNENLVGVEGNYGDQAAMLELSYNIFHGGSDVAKQKETANFVGQAEQIRDRTYDQIVENMKLSWDALVTSKSQLDYFKQHRDSSIVTVSAYTKQFQQGRRTLVDLLNAQNELFNAKIDYTNGRSNVIFSKYRVFNGEGKLLSYLRVPVNYSSSSLPVAQPIKAPGVQPVAHTPVLQPQTASQASSSQSSVKAGYSVKDKQIAQQAMNNYTIQLYSSYDKTDAVNFIIKNNLQNQAAFYQTKYLGQTKFVVIMGSYGSPQQALTVMQSLPKTLQDWNPVIKPLNVVQSEIAS